MKKLLAGVVFVLLISLFGGVVSAFEMDEIYTSEQVAYNPETGKWSRVITKKIPAWLKQEDLEETEVDPSIILTKRTSTGTGSYSLYFYDKKNLAIALRSNYEFVQDGRLIAVDNANLKYYEIVYAGGKFKEVPLTDSQLKEIFDDAQIVKISEFKNDKYTTTKRFFSIKRLLLVNDTDKSFYKFSYKPPKVQQTDVKGYITSPKYEKIIFSHYGDKDGALEINIKRK